MELKDYFRVILKYLWLSGTVGLLAAAAGLVASWYLGLLPLYGAVATVMVGGDVATVENNTTYLQLSDQFLETYANLATREPVLQGVITELNLDTTPDDLKEAITAVVVESTQLIEITARNRDPKLAADIANSVARQMVNLPSVRVRNFVLVAEEAQPPIFPNLSFALVTIVAGLLGFLFMAGLTFLLEFMRAPVYSESDVARVMELPVLATVRPPMRGGRQPRPRLAVLRKANQAVWWPLVQTCRRRFAELNLPINPHPRPPRVLVTEPTPGKSKSLVAANLATAWAQAGEKVILVDADIQSPSLDKAFNLSNETGLADLMSNAADADAVSKALQPTDIPGLRVLPAGKANGRTSAGLSDKDFDQVLRELEKQADAIVVNGAPVLTGGQGAMMAAQSHGVLLVLHAGHTPLTAAGDAQDALALSKDNLWGTILADVN
jgi:capsular exopolysaccharide synthesis family protein